MVYTFPDMGMVDPAAAPGPANPTLEQVMPGLGDTSPQRNTNLEFSAERQLNDSTLVRVTPFITKSTNLGDYYTDPTTFITRYENVGKGETKGVEVFLRKKMSDNWQGWLSYTNQAAKATKANLGLVTSMYNTNWDQRHTLSLVSNYKGGKFGHTVRADIGSGRADIDAPSFTGRANPSCIMSYGLTVDLPKGSNLGDSLYVNVFNVFNNHQTMQYRWAGGVRGRHSWVPTRFISVGVSSAF